VDVPLDFDTRSDKGRSCVPVYELLPAEAISEFDAPSARDAGMYFWAWRHATKEGFHKASTLYWVKTLPDRKLDHRGMGYYGMEDPAEEHWVSRRGAYVAPMLGDGFERIAWLLPAEDENSTKPQVFYDEIARLHAGIELFDMFARKRQSGWWACGDQISDLIQPPL
jgi:N6-adenosine-specific RNA methylase IME4